MSVAINIITIVATDASGNVSKTPVFVRVPHDKHDKDDKHR